MHARPSYTETRAQTLHPQSHSDKTEWQRRGGCCAVPSRRRAARGPESSPGLALGRLLLMRGSQGTPRKRDSGRGWEGGPVSFLSSRGGVPPFPFVLFDLEIQDGLLLKATGFESTPPNLVSSRLSLICRLSSWTGCRLESIKISVFCLVSYSRLE